MAQQASEFIILSLTPAEQVQRFHGVDVERVVDAVHAGGDGLYLVGLDFHVGFLLREAGEVRFCHSSYLTPGTVVCEDALSAPALPSRYTVLGKLMQKRMISQWLEGAPIRTVTSRG
ncbi:MAG: hypothetical protein H6741_21515 [Alphaproteobacteria bacterium]|nr:hypothetical protein [Alphaproteobacteria bacterium]